MDAANLAPAPNPASPPGPPEPTSVERTFRLHRRAFYLGNGVLTLANIYTGPPWWGFWPLIVSGGALMIHFLFYRAATVDDDWVEERTEDLRAKSYDLAHIDSIRKQAESYAGSLSETASTPTGSESSRSRNGA